MTTTASDFYQTGDAATFLGCSKSYVVYLEIIGELKAERTVGRFRIFRRAELERFKLKWEAQKMARQQSLASDQNGRRPL